MTNQNDLTLALLFFAIAWIMIMFLDILVRLV